MLVIVMVFWQLFVFFVILLGVQLVLKLFYMFLVQLGFVGQWFGFIGQLFWVFNSGLMLVSGFIFILQYYQGGGWGVLLFGGFSFWVQILCKINLWFLVVGVVVVVFVFVLGVIGIWIVIWFKLVQLFQLVVEECFSVLLLNFLEVNVVMGLLFMQLGKLIILMDFLLVMVFLLDCQGVLYISQDLVYVGIGYIVINGLILFELGDNYEYWVN